MSGDGAGRLESKNWGLVHAVFASCVRQRENTSSSSIKRKEISFAAQRFFSVRVSLLGGGLVLIDLPAHRMSHFL